MVYEVVDLEVNPGEEDAFASAFAEVLPELTGAAGCHSVRLIRGIESPSRFLIIVEWESVQAHVENFATTERADRWRAGVGPFFAGRPRVEHFADG